MSESKVYDYSIHQPTSAPLMDYVINPAPQVKMSIEPENDLTELLGKHLMYVYANGWKYEFYFRNETEGDYRISTGAVAGRWTTRQRLILVALGDGIYKVGWVEPVGTFVCLVLSLKKRWIHGFFGLAAWIGQDPTKAAIRHQNAHLDDMRAHRDKGPVQPYDIQWDWAEITYMEDRGLNNDEVINCGPDELPAGYLDRKN